MPGFVPASDSDVDDFLQLADRMRELSNEVDQFATAHCQTLSGDDYNACRHSSMALNDAFNVLVGNDLDARIQAAKAGIDMLQQITSAAQTTIRKVKRIETDVQIIIALGGVAVGIAEKDPGAVKDAASKLADAIQGSSAAGAQPAQPASQP